MKITRWIFQFLFLSLLIHNLKGQGTQQVQVNPDCPVVNISVTFNSGSGATLTLPGGNGFDNRALGCQTYVLEYVATATSGALTSVAFQSAAGAVTPGGFANFAGTVSTGINPNTSNTGAISTFSTGCTSSSACTVANSWLNVLITRGTFVGTIQIVVYGWKQGSAKAGGGGGGGGAVSSVNGTTNQVACSPTTGAVVCGIPTNPIFPGIVSASGFQSNETFSGTLNLSGLTSGAVWQAVDDIAGTAIVYIWPATNGTIGQILSDSGATTCPTLPAGAPSMCHQLAWVTGGGGGGSSGGGVLGYSASALTLPSAGTTFLAPVGGALASATEANVTANAPAAAAISNMYVSLSAAPGTGNSITFTFRDAGSSTAVTCTISGTSATNCHDSTHSFTPIVGDALSIQVVTSGTVTIAPAINIISEYGVSGGGGGSSTWNNVRAFDNPPTTGWTGDNATTFDVTNGYPYLHQARSGAATMGVEYQTAPAAPYTCTVQFLDDMSGFSPGSLSGTSGSGLAIVFGDGTGKYVYWGTYADGGGPGLWTSKWTSSTGGVSGTYTLQQGTAAQQYQPYLRQAKWFQIVNNSTNLLFNWSIDGNHWKQFDSRAVGDFLGAITRVGFAAFTQESTGEVAIPSWKCQ